MPIVHWLPRHVVAALSPFLAYFYGSISLKTAILAGVGLFIANVIVGFFAFAAEPKTAAENSQAEAMIRFGDLLSVFKKGAVPAGKRNLAFTSCLGLLEVYAR